MAKRIKNYKIHRLLGHGNSAEVHLATEIQSGRQVALKLLHAFITDQKVKDNFLHEADIIRRLQHSSIVRVLDADFDDTRPFLVLTYAPNGNLRKKYPRTTVLPNNDILNYARNIGQALEYAHQQDIIHRDVKPENILLNERNAPLLSDFGIARIAQHTLTQSTQQPAGTPIYAAPEQLMGKPKKASDQYSLAIMIYEWLCGRPHLRAMILPGSMMPIVTRRSPRYANAIQRFPSPSKKSCSGP
ncbi:serine/threonine-protein kinase [Dictyobacter kobayashii]|nr:serine/threonine-protein kinase [Dictyobacter kobayashii]